jgi:hypothetical protein
MNASKGALLPSNDDVLPAAMTSAGAYLASNDVLPAALMSSEASNAAETLQADYPVGLSMIEMLLNYEPDFLGVRELGNLSISSKTLFKLINPRWGVLWEQYAEAGAEFKEEKHRWKGYPTHIWTDEKGLLPCFTSPDMKVLERCGYKHAVGCLRSKVCCKCGEIAASANPFTLDRLCNICAEEDENSWLIHKPMAKYAFLLGEVDLRALASASVQYRTINGIARSDAITVVFLLTDVVKASFAKHGGVVGLEAAFEKKKAVAMQRYQKSQSTDKPQQNKLKITTMLTRPADNLKRLKAWFSTLPVGVLYTAKSAEGRGNDACMQMVCPAKCFDCGVNGSEVDVGIHGRLHHGILPPWGYIVPASTSPPNQGISLSVLLELRQVLAGAQKVRGHRVEVTDETDSEWRSCDLTFDENGCRVSVDMTEMDWSSYSVDLGNFCIYAQLASNKMPMELLNIGFGEHAGDNNIAEEKCFDDLIKALGLKETKPSQLLAALLMEAVPIDFFLRKMEDLEEYGFGFSDIVRDACVLLKAAKRTGMDSQMLFVMHVCC